MPTVVKMGMLFRGKGRVAPYSPIGAHAQLFQLQPYLKAFLVEIRPEGILARLQTGERAHEDDCECCVFVCCLLTPRD